MRIVRLTALVGSVMLLVATTVWMIAVRSELRQAQESRVVAGAALAGAAASATVNRAIALVEAANGATDPTALVASFDDDASACVVADAGKRCSDVDLVALGGFEAAAGASVGRGAALVVDPADDSLLVVHRALAAGESTAAIRLPATSLLDAHASDGLGRADVAAEIHLSRRVAGADSSGQPRYIAGQVVVDRLVALPGGDGSIAVRAVADDDVGLVGDGLPLYAALLSLGTILMGLAGWTFLLDRRALERRATTDELTGLANRREFERQTDDALLTAERFNTGVCVMLIDLNGFKQINDTLGHQVGDRVLQRAAQRLRSAVRETDLVARWGGDEFVILLPGVEDGTGVRSSAERVGQALGGAPIVDDITVTAAIGAALFPRHGATLDELVRAADVAMYSAKSTGVTYRLADPLAVDQPTISTPSGYHGPDRRRPVANGDPAE